MSSVTPARDNICSQWLTIVYNLVRTRMLRTRMLRTRMLRSRMCALCACAPVSSSRRFRVSLRICSPSLFVRVGTPGNINVVGEVKTPLLRYTARPR